MKVVQSGTLGSFHRLTQRFACEAVLIPFHARLRVVAVRSDLHRGSRTMLVEGSDPADEFFFRTVPPEFQFVLLDRVHTKLGPLAGLHTLRPRVPQQTV